MHPRGTTFVWLFAYGFAAFSLRYLLPQPPFNTALLSARHPVLLPVHVGTAAVALATGPLQFIAAVRARRPQLHRWLGRTYVAAVLISGSAGLGLSPSMPDPVLRYVFGSLAATWLLVTAIAWGAALRRDFTAHRRWMIRSYSVTFAAITVRLAVPLIFIPMGGAHVMANPFSPSGVSVLSDASRLPFMTWPLNLVFAEWLIRRRHAPLAKAASSSV